MLSTYYKAGTTQIPTQVPTSTYLRITNPHNSEISTRISQFYRKVMYLTLQLQAGNGPTKSSDSDTLFQRLLSTILHAMQIKWQCATTGDMTALPVVCFTISNLWCDVFTSLLLFQPHPSTLNNFQNNLLFFFHPSLLVRDIRPLELKKQQKQQA